MRQIVVIINAAGGSYSEEVERSIRDEFSSQGVDASFEVARSGDEIEEIATRAVDRGVETIVACGGDGTVSGVAAKLIGTETALGVIALGTLNNFSKDLSIPAEIPDAVGVIAARNTLQIDAVEANGRKFINNSSIGLYPRIVRRREQRQRLGYGKWGSAFWAAIRIFRIARFLRVKIEIDGESYLRKTPFVFVGNNQYDMDLYNIGRRQSLSEGKLSIYFLHRGGRWGVIIMLLKTITGTLKQWRDFEEVLTETVTIQTRRRKLSVAFDGEVTTMKTPLTYKILPGALTVIVPAENTDA